MSTQGRVWFCKWGTCIQNPCFLSSTCIELSFYRGCSRSSLLGKEYSRWMRNGYGEGERADSMLISQQSQWETVLIPQGSSGKGWKTHASSLTLLRGKRAGVFHHGEHREILLGSVNAQAFLWVPGQRGLPCGQKFLRVRDGDTRRWKSNRTHWYGRMKGIYMGHWWCLLQAP